jgi:endonuclease YncB( thermonuclease family)
MPTAAVLFCLVVAIADGDTLTARCGEPGAYEQVKVRIAGIDAPEKAQPFGQRSKEALSDLCFREAATINPTTRDRYGRTVAEVQCKGQDVGETQVSAGMAWVFDKYSLGYENLYPLQDEARGGAVGLWAHTMPVAPWEWRARIKAASVCSPSRPIR